MIYKVINNYNITKIEQQKIPFVWSKDGPVPPDGVFPECLVQSNRSPLALIHLQNCVVVSSKSQLPLAKKGSGLQFSKN